MRASLKTFALLGGLGIAGLFCAITAIAPAVHAAPPSKPSITEDARAVIAQMGKSLLTDQLSFRARTLRVYAGTNGEPLHIAHSMKVTVRRPDRFLLDLTGDDGSSKLTYNGKTVVIYGVETKKYATIEVPNTIQGMLDTLIGSGGVDFPLADFLTNSPDKSFLLGVTSGREINTVMIDGVPCRHLLFTQPPGIELELWVEKNDRALPRRLIITYRSVPGQPSFIAELFDWNLSVHAEDSEFAFQPPEGATPTDLVVPGKPSASGQKGTGK